MSGTNGISTSRNNKYMKILISISAVMASLLCLLGGLWILKDVDYSSNDAGLWGGIGLYFMGKAFFVGPMLWVALNKIVGPNENPSAR